MFPPTEQIIICMCIDTACAPLAMSAQQGKKGEGKATLENKGVRNRRSSATAPGTRLRLSSLNAAYSGGVGGTALAKWRFYSQRLQETKISGTLATRPHTSFVTQRRIFRRCERDHPCKVEFTFSRVARNKIFRHIGPDFEPIQMLWLEPLWKVFHGAYGSRPAKNDDPYDYVTCDGGATFELSCLQ